MKKIRLWIETGYVGADYDEIIEVPDDVSEEELWEYAEEYVWENISYGWTEE